MAKKSYRGRATRRIKGSGNRKPACPTARFSLNKSYWCVPSAGLTPGPQEACLLQINASTPFQPITEVFGLWSANDTNNEPHGLSSDIYNQYRHVVVRGCHVKVAVMDSPDNEGAETNSLLEGTVSIARTTDTGVITKTTLNHELRNMFGTKMRDFSMAPHSATSPLTKNCALHSGYSPSKQWKQSALTNEDLKIVNTAGSSNAPNDSTYLMLAIRPSSDTVQGNNLKPFKVQVRLSYILTFLEPTAVNNIPMPFMGYTGNYARTAKRVIKTASYGAAAGAAAGLSPYIMAPIAYAARRRYPIQRG